MVQRISFVLLINLCYPEVSLHLFRVFYVLVRVGLGADMVYVSSLLVDSVQKKGTCIYLYATFFLTKLHFRLTVASLEAGWDLNARLKRERIPYLISLFQLYPPAKPINMKHSFPS